ncbi:hypothetical protein GBAR_LOCUS27345 [Geodia barretti]|uniref:Uncharacterized protein n=1 Tax=Geodia barretti TaxID=519541 RepID=A0AA35XFL5_GEOBA|nr:hypothetical protein GBAR_LOCUS27345 [Geodia barretti]
MTPLRWVTGGGDQENSTSLSPGTACNISGDPDGAEGVLYCHRESNGVYIVRTMLRNGSHVNKLFCAHRATSTQERECPKRAHCHNPLLPTMVFVCSVCVYIY